MHRTLIMILLLVFVKTSYAAHILEPELAKYDPRKQMQMDRLLNSMLYSIEDGESGKFQRTKAEFIREIDKYFDLTMPEVIFYNR